MVQLGTDINYNDPNTLVLIHREAFDFHRKSFDKDSSYLPEHGDLDNFIGYKSNLGYRVFNSTEMPFHSQEPFLSLRRDAGKLAEEMIFAQAFLRNGRRLPKPGFKLDDLLGEDVVHRITSNQDIIFAAALDLNAMIYLCCNTGKCKANGQFVDPSSLSPVIVAKIISPYEHISSSCSVPVDGSFTQYELSLKKLREKASNRSLPPTLFNLYDEDARREVLDSGDMDKYLQHIGISRNEFLERNNPNAVLK